MIVRRNRPAVGEKRPRMIVRRVRRVPPPEEPRRPWFSTRWLTAGLALVLVGMLVYAGIWLWRSPVFEVAHVEVEGNQRVSTDTIVDRANLFGQRMFTADIGAAQARVYGIPLVSAVKVERRWPDRIRIVVEERRPWGTWEQAGITYTIDREGYVLGTLPPPAGLPAIRSAGIAALTQGERVDYHAVDAAAEIYEQLPRQLGTTVSEVAYLEGQGVQVTTADGRTALLGDSSSIAYKLAVWAALAAEARQRGINYTSIDLRYGNRPVVRQEGTQ